VQPWNSEACEGRENWFAQHAATSSCSTERSIDDDAAAINSRFISSTACSSVSRASLLRCKSALAWTARLRAVGVHDKEIMSLPVVKARLEQIASALAAAAALQEERAGLLRAQEDALLQSARASVAADAAELTQSKHRRPISPILKRAHCCSLIASNYATTSF
jgi:hypothetical protein